MNYTFCKSYLGLFLLIVVLSVGLVSAVDCPSGWTFIDKESYNVCYLPNVIQTGSMNITDNNNNTILEYQSSYYTVLGTTVVGKVNYSDINNKYGINYLKYNQYDDNVTIDGLMYFSDNLITISEKRDIYKNTTVQRTQWKVYNKSDIYWKEDSPTLYRFNGTASIASSPNIVYLYGGVNFTIMHTGSRYITLNKTDIYYPENRYINVTFRHGINLTDNSAGTTMIMRYNNFIEMKHENTQTILDTTTSFIDSNHVTAILFGNNEDGTFNDSYNNFQNLKGLISNYAVCGSTIYSSACAHWDISTNLVYNLYDYMHSNNNLTKEISAISLLHLNNLYINETNVDNTLTAGYDFNMPILDFPLMTHNAWNNSHTRLISDLLNQLSVYKKLGIDTAVSNNISNVLINYLQTEVNNGFILGKGLHHSTNTKNYYGNNTPVNILSVGISSLINAKEAGYNVNLTLLDIYIDTLRNYTNYMFNETSSYNDSFYDYGAVNQYFGNSHNYLSFSYVLAEQFDGRVAYMYTKDNIFRENMTNRKINEMIYKWNGTKIIHIGGNITNVNCDTMILYQNLSVNSFTNKDNNLVSTPMYCTSYFNGWNKIPSNRVFVNLIYPTFLTKENTTFFIDEEDNIIFETPAYAMIPDFHYNNNLTGMVIYNKWAYNTTGNFTNLSTSSYKYFYSPQHNKFINYSEQLTWNATSGTENMWVGNLSDSVNFRGNNGALNIYSDNEILGNYNDRLTNLHSVSKRVQYKTMTKAIFHNSTSLCNGSSANINSNTGNINITLAPNEFCYVLDDYKPTLGVTRENDPIWNGKRATNNLGSTITFTLDIGGDYKDLIYNDGSTTKGVKGERIITLDNGEWVEIGTGSFASSDPFGTYAFILGGGGALISLLLIVGTFYMLMNGQLPFQTFIKCIIIEVVMFLVAGMILLI